MGLVLQLIGNKRGVGVSRPPSFVMIIAALSVGDLTTEDLTFCVLFTWFVFWCVLQGVKMGIKK